MVSLVNKFAAKVEEKKGALSEDEVSRSSLHFHSHCSERLFTTTYVCMTSQTVQFKAYLLSVGIANPVTK